MANTPVLKKRCGTLNTAVFAHTMKRQDDSEYITYSVSVQKSYKDQQGEWQQQTISVFDNQLSDLILLLQSTAFSLMAVKNPAQKQDSAAQPAAQPATQPAAQPAPAQAAVEISDDIPF